MNVSHSSASTFVGHSQPCPVTPHLGSNEIYIRPIARSVEGAASIPATTSYLDRIHSGDDFFARAFGSSSCFSLVEFLSLILKK